MLMLRAGPRDGKHERCGAETGSNNHRDRPLPPIDPVPLVSQDSPHVELLAGWKSQAWGAASNPSPRRREPPRHGTARRGGRAGVRQGSKGPVPSNRRRALSARMEPRRVGQRTRAAWSSRPLPRPGPAAPPRDAQLGEIDPDRLDLGVEIEARSAELPPEA